MIQTNISLEIDQHQLIKKHCEENGCSLSWFLRSLIDDYFKVTVDKTEIAKPVVVFKEKSAFKVTNDLKSVEQIIPKSTTT
jgi:hypothetical protein